MWTNSVEEAEQSLANSLRLLKTDYVDVLYLLDGNWVASGARFGGVCTAKVTEDQQCFLFVCSRDDCLRIGATTSIRTGTPAISVGSGLAPGGRRDDDGGQGCAGVRRGLQAVRHSRR